MQSPEWPTRLIARLARLVRPAVALGCLALSAGFHPAAAAPSFIGPTGGFTAPNPLTLAPEKTEVALHVEGVNELNPSQLANETVFDLSTKVTVGVYDFMELGIEQTFRVNSGLQNESFYINAKYRFPYDTFNVAVGVLAATNGIDYSTGYVVMGWKVIYGGFGVNFGGKSFRELRQDQFINVGIAKMGGYTLKRLVTPGSDTFSGEADTFFGIVGLDYKIAENLELIADYDGDRFGAGFRIPFHSWGFDAGYVTQRAADTLFSRETEHWKVGFFGHW